MCDMALDGQQQHEMVNTFKSITEKRLSERRQAVLMAAQGRTQADIAAALCVSVCTVRRFVRPYRQRGLEGLAIRWEQRPQIRPRIQVSRRGLQFRPPARHPALPAPYRSLRGGPDTQRAAQQKLTVLKEKAAAEELVLLRQDEERRPEHSADRERHGLDAQSIANCGSPAGRRSPARATAADMDAPDRAARAPWTDRARRGGPGRPRRQQPFAVGVRPDL